MLTAQTVSLSAAISAKHVRLVSFENSNSWLKRHDSEGTKIIQAGYLENPPQGTIGTESSPVVLLTPGDRRWYGVTACRDLNHVRTHGLSKIDTARASFAACLRPSDDQKDLIVIASHWESAGFPALQKALMGAYRVFVNGHEINCKVIKVIPILEGLGSYHSAKSRLQPGESLLIELGYGTAESWLLDEDGQQFGAPSAIDSLGVYSVIREMQNDSLIRSLAADGSAEVCSSLLSRALQSDRCGRLDPQAWAGMKGKYSANYLNRLIAHLRTKFSSQTQTLVNVIVTGGGAAFLLEQQPKFGQAFIVPEHPQTASVRGAYLMHEAIANG